MDSRNTILTDRILWYDGESSFDPGNLLQLVMKYDVSHVTGESPAVRTFNKHVPKDQEITVKTSCASHNLEWNIPDEYKQLDVFEYLSAKHIILTDGVAEGEATLRDIRLIQEFTKYKAFGLVDVLRTIIWIINTLTAKDVVWGVGRGSSVSSYVLYIIGVHDVDSYSYDLDIDDFLHD